MKNLAELKKIKVGTAFKLVDTYEKPHKLLNTTRKVNLVQSNAIRFEPLEGQSGGGSWLYFPKASEFVGTERGFIILEDVPVYDEHGHQTQLPNGDILKKTVNLLTYELV
jgi:hypothetical protein